MKPILINNVLDLTLEARRKGRIFHPLFTGEAGLGKSAIIKQWAMEQKKKNPNYKYIDLRIAYMEAPDFIGFPESEEVNGEKRTCHHLPEFWPTEGEGILVFEEPNRGTTGVMNCLMQILTDFKVHNYTLPEGWIMCAAINPDSAEYDVNAMDAALKNRFVEYEIEYDHNSFCNFIEDQSWDENLCHWIKGSWMFKDSKSIAKEGKYISPRTLEQVNTAEASGAQKDRAMHFVTVCSILGKHMGKEYHKFVFDEAPILYTDLITDIKGSLAKLKAQGKGTSYNGDMIAVTVESIIKHYNSTLDDDKVAMTVGENTMAKVAKTIPADQAINLIRSCGFKSAKGNIIPFFKEFVNRHPELIDLMKANLTAMKMVPQS